MSYLPTGLHVVLLTIACSDGFLFDVKTDCLVTSWSSWAEMPGLDVHIRERGILRHDNKGGAPCPPDDELREIKPDPHPSPLDSQIHIQATARSMSTNFIRREPKPGNPTQPGHVRDLLIVLDSSGSISKSDFERTKHNLAELMGMLCPDPDPFAQLYNHAALLDFSNSVMEVFDFNRYHGIAALKRALLSVPQIAGRTCTTKALDAASQMLATWKGMRSDSLVDKEVLILTDGHSNCGGDVLASALKLRGKAKVFSLLIGSFSQSGLNEILNYVTTPAPNHLFAIKTHQGLDQLMSLLRSQSSLVPCMPFDLPSNSG
ncbi:integrin alpha-X-like [Mercenaria mercenaria]|uniref:integrin alpha-X-like n=1 Tax=Mercenaria mercenaria TaxID=6596 RepID=UPI00234E78DB|nr:integrin alpha-X-like [Mercenaria mercenaria]